MARDVAQRAISLAQWSDDASAASKHSLDTLGRHVSFRACGEFVTEVRQRSRSRCRAAMASSPARSAWCDTAATRRAGQWAIFGTSTCRCVSAILCVKPFSSSPAAHRSGRAWRSRGKLRPATPTSIPIYCVSVRKRRPTLFNTRIGTGGAPGVEDGRGC